jgi:hypothetical protein
VEQWATLLVGLVGGIAATLVGVYYGEWLRDNRARRNRGAQLVTSIRVLLEEADPASFVLGSMQERNQRHGRWLWGRWRELRVPFLEFGLLGSRDVRERTKKAATDVAFTVQALRNAVDDTSDSDSKAKSLKAAKLFREQAGESLDRLEEALTAPGGELRAKRLPATPEKRQNVAPPA